NRVEFSTRFFSRLAVEILTFVGRFKLPRIFKAVSQPSRSPDLTLLCPRRRVKLYLCRSSASCLKIALPLPASCRARPRISRARRSRRACISTSAQAAFADARQRQQAGEQGGHPHCPLRDQAGRHRRLTGQPESTAETNPWLADLRKETKQ